MDNIPGLSCRILKKFSAKRYLQDRHCFADSYWQRSRPSKEGERWWVREGNTNFSQVFNFANFHPFAKTFQWNFWRTTHTPFTLRLQEDQWINLAKLPNPQEALSKGYMHCFADSCKLEWTTVWQCVRLYATPIVYYVCGVCMQQIYEIISSKLAIHGNLDPQKFLCYMVCFIAPFTKCNTMHAQNNKESALNFISCKQFLTAY